MCSALPYGNGICHYAFICYLIVYFIVSVCSFFIKFLNLVLINETQGQDTSMSLPYVLFFFLTGVVIDRLLFFKICV